MIITATPDSVKRFLKGDQGVSSKAMGTVPCAVIDSLGSSKTVDLRPIAVFPGGNGQMERVLSLIHI